MITVWAWPLVTLGCLGWVLAAVAGIGHVVRHLRRHPPAKAPVPPSMPPSVAPRAAPARNPRLAGSSQPGAGPAPNDSERELLTKIRSARLAAGPQAVENSRIVADGLRVRFPQLDDTTLGLVALYLLGYITSSCASGASALWVLQVVTDAYGLAAEELTRPLWQGAPR